MLGAIEGLDSFFIGVKPFKIGSALTIGAKRLAAAATRLEQAPDALGTAQRSAVRTLIEELKAVSAATRADGNAAAA